MIWYFDTNLHFTFVSLLHVVDYMFDENENCVTHKYNLDFGIFGTCTNLYFTLVNLLHVVEINV